MTVLLFPKALDPSHSAAFALLALLALPAAAIVPECSTALGCTGDVPAAMCGFPHQRIETGTGCNGVDNCQQPTLAKPRYEADPLPVTAGEPPRFRVRMTLDVQAPWNVWARQENPNGQLQVRWIEHPPADDGDAGDDGTGKVSVCPNNLTDHAVTWIEKTLTCAQMHATRNLDGTNHTLPTYTVTAAVCGPPCNPEEPACGPVSTCHRFAEEKGVAFSVPEELLHQLCPKTDCDDGSGCQGPGCAVSPGGAGPPGFGYSPGGVGPGGVGGGDPGGDQAASVARSRRTLRLQALGRFWSHRFAERLETEDAPRKVTLITRDALHRIYYDLDGDGRYEKVVPSSEKRRLTRRPDTNYELEDPEGTVQRFDRDGVWLETWDRYRRRTQPTYRQLRLATVELPDRRVLRFTYHPEGQLATVTEEGVGGDATREWQYSWEGLDLTRIDRPDGTAWTFRYDDPQNPGYLTRQTLVGTDGSERIERSWQWDAYGNLTRSWRGTAQPTDPAAVDLVSYGYDHPWNPTEIRITDALGNTSTSTFRRDPASNQLVLLKTEGDCPSCGLGPNTQLFYDDPQNPLLPTREVDGRGTETLLEYDEHGELIARTEAFGTELARTTTWERHPDYPGLLTAVEEPSTSGAGVHRTSWTWNDLGHAVKRIEEGVEHGEAFSYTTEMRYWTPAPNPTRVDPPGFWGLDATEYEYAEERGSQVVAERKDPLIGTTTFGYDPFNRRIQTTDPNGLITETSYDALDRVVSVTQKGATAAEDLITSYVYNPFGDLVQTILPEGNVIEYGYDPAGRLTSIERKPTAAPDSHGERTFYHLDAVGHRTREELQGWTGTAWQTESATDYVYTTRCQLDRIVHADGTVTDFEYDCEGNLTAEWDANHPKDANPPTRSYAYDALSRLTTVTEPWGGGGEDEGPVVVRYGYDVQDHLVEVVDGNGTVTRFQYSDRDLLTQEVSEVSGTTEYGYNEHGALTETTDAREVTVTRMVDELDRVRRIYYSEDFLQAVGFVYDDPEVPYSKGRLTAIERDLDGPKVEYRYDRFGRTIQDGKLAFGYDKNGNRSTIGYPGGVTAAYQHDYADRETGLTLQRGAEDPETLATGATYHPTGPLETVTLGNGLVEHRPYTNRYFPGSIVVGEHLHWQYTTDAVGNILAITDPEDPTETRSYGYQDVQYYLTEGNGPWGEQAWTYDRIGNRLTQTRDGELTAYSYNPNAAGNNSPQLHSTTENPPDGPVTRYFFDPAGNLTHENAERHRIRYKYSNEGRLSEIRTDEANRPPTLTTVLYDGRSFLDTSVLTPFLGITPTTWTTTATYSSEGTLHHRHIDRPKRADQLRTDPAVMGDDYVVYFAGRPLAQLSVRTSTVPGEEPEESSRVLYLTTDHLGTPVLATDGSGGVVWRGGFEPFGADYSGASEAGVFLRFPGQWVDSTWLMNSISKGIHYNLHRWYEPRQGAYLSPDPLGVLVSLNIYAYVESRPLLQLDPTGAIHLVAVTPKEREVLLEAIAILRRDLAKPEACQCWDYFENQENLTFQGLSWVFSDGTPPYIWTRERIDRDAKVNPAIRGWSPPSEPFQTSWIYKDNFRPSRAALSKCDLASLILHETAHLARKDTDRTEDKEMFEKCRVGCLNPGKFK